MDGVEKLCGDSHEPVTTAPRHHQIDDVDRRVVNGGGLVVDESGVIFGDEHIAWARVCFCLLYTSDAADE